VRQALGQHDDAEAMWRQVISVCERSLGSQHVATTTAVERLAESCAARGKHREAVQLRAQATSMREAPAALAAPGHALVVLPSSNGALTVGEQPTLAPAASPTTQDALLAIHAELLATDDTMRDTRRRRRWPVFAAAAAVLGLLGGLTASGAASTFGARPNDGAPAWAAWSPPKPLTSGPDSAAAATESALYEVRLAAEVPGGADAPAIRPLTHARLIGPAPRLPLPEILADRRIDDVVVVRFAVDASGVPDTTSLAVVRTPHGMLTDVVRRAIPELRFEPARRAIPGAPGEPDVVEMAFRFSRAVP
jgi:hypothetical protein